MQNVDKHLTRMREAQESGRVTVGKSIDYQEVERIMNTRIEFLVEKARENASSEDELHDNLLDIAEHVEKMLADETGVEDVTKRTVIVEQYTRQDGTVVPRHERKISARAAAALTGALGAAALASPLGRPLRQGFNAGRQTASGGMDSWRAIYGARSAPGTRAGLEVGGAVGGAGRGAGNFMGGLNRATPGNPTRAYRAGSGARSQADSFRYRGLGAREGAASAARRFTPNAQMQSGVAGQGLTRGAQNARSALQTGAREARINFGAGRSMGAQGGLGMRGAMATGQVSPSLGAGVAAGSAQGTARRAGRWANDLSTTEVTLGGAGAGLVGIPAAAYGTNRLRERTRKSLTDADVQVLEKYLGRNLDG